MNTTMRRVAFVVALGLLWQCAKAGTVIGLSGITCYPPTSSAPSGTVTLKVYGDWIENIDRATSPTGVTVTIVAKYNGAQNNTPPHAGRGRVDLRISTSNASPGNKEIQLINDPDFGLGGETFKFTISVVALPTVTNVSVPQPSDPFKEITITFTGTGLQGADDPARGVIVRDDLVPFITIGGDAQLSSVRVLSSSPTSLQAKLFFSAMVQDVTVDLTFRDINNYCNPLGTYVIGGDGLKQRVRVRSSNIKNYVSEITFPDGNTFTTNSIATIHIKLLFPAPGGSTRTYSFTVGGRRYTGLLPDFANTLDNSRVFFRLVPANAFEGVPGGTPYSQTGFNEVRANAGEDIIPITVKVIDCLGGRPGATNVVKIETWMHTTNSSLPPNFVEKTFRVRCP